MKIMRNIWDESGATRTVVLAIIFIVLLGATIMQRAQRTKVAAAEKKVAEQPLLKLDVNQVYEIEIQELMGKTVLKKREGKWWAGFVSLMPNMGQEEKDSKQVEAWDYADEDGITQVLEQVTEGFKKWELVSTNREKKIDYRIGILGSKFKFKNEKGDVLACIEVGEKSADFTGTYISKCGEDNIYKIPGILDYIFKKDFNGWRSKQIYDIDKDKLVKFELKKPGGETIVLTKDKEGTWTGIAPKAFEPNKLAVDNLISNFATYTARGFPERGPAEEAVITTLEIELVGTTDDGKTYSLTFGKSERGPDQLVKGSENAMIYTANYMDMTNFNLTVENLMVPPPEQPKEGEPGAGPGPGGPGPGGPGPGPMPGQRPPGM